MLTLYLMQCHFFQKSFSIVLMVVIDATYKFVMVDIVAPGRHSDGGVFKALELGRRLENHPFDLSGPAKLPKSTKVAPHAFVGDEVVNFYMTSRTRFLAPTWSQTVGSSIIG